MKTLPQHLKGIFSDVKERLRVMKELLALTPSTHTDYGKLSLATKAYADMLGRVDGELENQKNYTKLLEIQASMVKTGLVGDSFLDKLATKDRTFLKEGDLVKVCRKKNKTFRFWLFSDELMYGAKYPGTTQFEFHRHIPLSSCSVTNYQGKGESETGLQINSSEKSFVVLNYTKYERDEWFEALDEAIKKARFESGLPEIDTIAAAPLWKADSAEKYCSICKCDFTFFKRKHHCRKCGDVVCGDCSRSKEILQELYGWKPVKVCDACKRGEKAITNQISVGNEGVRRANGKVLKAESTFGTTTVSSEIVGHRDSMEEFFQEEQAGARLPPRISSMKGDGLAGAGKNSSARAFTSDPILGGGGYKRPVLMEEKSSELSEDLGAGEEEKEVGEEAVTAVEEEAVTAVEEEAVTEVEEEAVTKPPPPPKPPVKVPAAAAASPILTPAEKKIKELGYKPPPPPKRASKPAPLPSENQMVGLLGSIKEGVSLKKTRRASSSSITETNKAGTSTPVRPVNPFLAEISVGASKLKSTADMPVLKKPPTEDGGLMGALSRALASRREFVDSDSSEDEGSDSDGWSDKE